MKKNSILISAVLMVVVLAVADGKKFHWMSAGDDGFIQELGCEANVPKKGTTNEEINFQAFILDDTPGDNTPGGLASVDYVGETPFNMRFVPSSTSGTFVQGSPSYEPGRNTDEDQFYHNFTRNLAVMQTEVSIKMWEELKDVEFHMTVDRPDEYWKGNVGVITTLIPPIDLDINNTIATIVGPPIMYKFVIMSLKGKRLPDENIYLSLERRMKCGVGKCGHCQINSTYVCQDGPVFHYTHAKQLEEAI